MIVRALNPAGGDVLAGLRITLVGGTLTAFIDKGVIRLVPTISDLDRAVVWIFVPVQFCDIHA